MKGLSIPRDARRHLSTTNIGVWTENEDQEIPGNVVWWTNDRLVFEKWQQELAQHNIVPDIRGT